MPLNRCARVRTKPSMDNLAHALVGAALGRAVADRHVPRAALTGIVAQHRKAEIRQQALRRFGAGAAWAALTHIGDPFTWEAMYASVDTVAGDGWRLARNLRLRPVRHAIDSTTDGRACPLAAYSPPKWTR
jgi:hypothetical protein